MCIKYVSASTTCTSCHGGIFPKDDELSWCVNAQDMGSPCAEDDWHVEIQTLCNDCVKYKTLLTGKASTKTTVSPIARVKRESYSPSKSTSGKSHQGLIDSLKQLTLTPGGGGNFKIRKALPASRNRLPTSGKPVSAKLGGTSKRTPKIGDKKMKLLEQELLKFKFEDKEELE